MSMIPEHSLIFGASELVRPPDICLDNSACRVQSSGHLPLQATSSDEFSH